MSFLERRTRPRLRDFFSPINISLVATMPRCNDHTAAQHARARQVDHRDPAACVRRPAARVGVGVRGRGPQLDRLRLAFQRCGPRARGEVVTGEGVSGLGPRTETASPSLSLSRLRLIILSSPLLSHYHSSAAPLAVVAALPPIDRSLPLPRRRGHGIRPTQLRRRRCVLASLLSPPPRPIELDCRPEQRPDRPPTRGWNWILPPGSSSAHFLRLSCWRVLPSEPVLSGSAALPRVV